MAQEVIIRPAPDVEKIAKELMSQDHDELTEAVVLYLFTSAGASCVPQKCNPKFRYFGSTHVKGTVKAEVAAGPDFIMWINEEEWEYWEADGKLRPFVAHRVAHLGRELTADGTPRWILTPHPVEEFPSIIQRFGPWNDGLKQIRAILQPELEFGEPVNTHR